MNGTTSPTPIAEGIQRATFVAVTSVEKFAVAIRRNMQYRKTVSALNSLDNRELADIGIVRADIQKIAKGLLN